jgi:ribose-phosphate pyrophosphokinase
MDINSDFSYPFAAGIASGSFNINNGVHYLFSKKPKILYNFIHFTRKIQLNIFEISHIYIYLANYQCHTQKGFKIHLGEIKKFIPLQFHKHTSLIMAHEVKIFSGRATRYLAENIALSFGTKLGEVQVIEFSDGEFTTSFEENLRGNDVYIVQSTFPPAINLLELLLMVDAAKRASARTITAVIPYFGFARQDRKDKPRVPISAKLIANLLTAAGVQRLITIDLHADQIQGFFDVPVDHLYASSIFLPYIKKLNLPNLIFASPDTGGTRRAASYAKALNTGFVICYKQRSKANQVDSMSLIGDVRGKDVVLLDDIIDTAGTICKAAQIMIDNGASSVRAFCTHPILSGDAQDRIDDSAFTQVIVTDTIPLRHTSPKIIVLTTASLLADVIKRAHNYESISSLFNIK